MFRWERKTDGGNGKVIIQSNLAKSVDTMAAMSEMRAGGNERSLDVACPVAPRSFPQRVLLATNHIPAYFKHILLLLSPLSSHSQNPFFKNKSREQTYFESIPDTLYISFHLVQYIVTICGRHHGHIL